MTSKLDVIRTPKVENVRLLEKFSKTSSSGTLYLTATHLIFVDPDNKKETWILHPHVASIEKLPLTTYGSPIHIRCKTFLSVRLVIPRERDCIDIYNAVLRLSQPADIRDLYCFHYSSPSKEISQPVGWNFFDLQAEFQRFGVPNELWCLTKINRDYEVRMATWGSLKGPFGEMAFDVLLESSPASPSNRLCLEKGIRLVE